MAKAKRTVTAPLTADQLQADPKNFRLHNARNQEAIRRSLEAYGAGRSILVDSANVAIAGNGVLEQAQALGLPVRVVESNGQELVVVKRTDLKPGDAERLGLALADNRTTDLSEWDEPALRATLEEMAPELQESAGWMGAELEEFLGEDGKYSSEVRAPIYEPKGECPPVTELADCERTNQLLTQIDAVEDQLPADVVQFLRMAAERHTRFDFGAIAEFYCHAEPDVQRLMEASGLVIVDLQRAIELGFVQLTERLGQIVDLEEGLQRGDAG